MQYIYYDVKILQDSKEAVKARMAAYKEAMEARINAEKQQEVGEGQ